MAKEPGRKSRGKVIAIVIGVIIVLFLLSRCGGGSDDAAAPQPTPAPAAAAENQPSTEVPEQAEAPAEPQVTAADVEARIADMSGGYATLDEACQARISGSGPAPIWACDVETIDVHANAIQVNYRTLADKGEPDQVARAWFNFLSLRGSADRSDAPMPDLNRVDVIDKSGMSGSQSGWNW